MPKIIDLTGAGDRKARPGQSPPNNVITNGPLRLRWGEWRTSHIIQVHVGSAARFEDYRAQCHADGIDYTGQMPPHFVLDGPMHDTALALLRHRTNEDNLIKVNYLAALMEALINTPCAILRTDLIRRVYQEVEKTGRELKLSWHAWEGRFLLPDEEEAGRPQAFRQQVAPLDNLSEFFSVLKSIAQRNFQVLAKKYVLYYPRPQEH